MRGGIGYVIVEIESRYNSGAGYRGIGGAELQVDTKFNPLQYVNHCGRVIQVPIMMGRSPVRQIPVGLPEYGPNGNGHHAIYAIRGVYEYKYIEDIHEDVRVGDKIWFQPLVLHRDTNLVDEFDRDGAKVYLFKVDYDLIICVERDKPKMVGGWVFLQPVFRDWGKALIPTYYEYVGPDGSKVAKPKDQWMVAMLSPRPEKMKGIIRHVGKPLKGDSFDFKTGDEVFVKRIPKWRYQYKGIDYMLLHQWDILAKISKIKVKDILKVKRYEKGHK